MSDTAPSLRPVALPEADAHLALGRPRAGPGLARPHPPAQNLVTDLDGLPPSVVKILVGALAAIAQRGSRRMTMSDICDVSGVSRGTLYKYFSSKEDVLAAVGEYISLTFERGVRSVAEGIDDPMQRLRVVLDYHAHYTIDQEADRLLAIEPDFLVGFFQSHFVRHTAAIADALGPVFDHFDAQTGERIDRQAASDAIIRVQLSSALVPPTAALGRMPDLLAQVLRVIAPGRAENSGEFG